MKASPVVTFPSVISQTAKICCNKCCSLIYLCCIRLGLQVYTLYHVKWEKESQFLCCKTETELRQANQLTYCNMYAHHKSCVCILSRKPKYNPFFFKYSKHNDKDTYHVIWCTCHLKTIQLPFYSIYSGNQLEQ